MLSLSLIAAAGTVSADIPVAVELVLAVDCSSSVDDREYGLQMQGIAAAFRDPAVSHAVGAAMPNGIAVTLVQWSGTNMQDQTIGWTHLTSAEDAEALADRIDATPRVMHWGATAVGEALAYSMTLFDGNNFMGVRRIIDVSGDGSSNQGIRPAEVRDMAVAAGFTINGLAILNEEPNLDAYYAENVIGGPQAFVERAADYDDFRRAMLRKLIREIGVPPSSGAPLADRPQLAQNPDDSGSEAGAKDDRARAEDDPWPR